MTYELDVSARGFERTTVVLYRFGNSMIDLEPAARALQRGGDIVGTIGMDGVFVATEDSVRNVSDAMLEVSTSAGPASEAMSEVSTSADSVSESVGLSEEQFGELQNSLDKLGPTELDVLGGAVGSLNGLLNVLGVEMDAGIGKALTIAQHSLGFASALDKVSKMTKVQNAVSAVKIKLGKAQTAVDGAATKAQTALGAATMKTAKANKVATASKMKKFFMMLKNIGVMLKKIAVKGILVGVLLVLKVIKLALAAVKLLFMAPKLLIIAAIVGVIAVVKALASRFQWIQGILDAVGNAFRAVGGFIRRLFGGSVEETADVVEESGEQISDSASRTADSVAESSYRAYEGVTESYSMMSEESIESMGGMFDNMGDITEMGTSNMLDGISEFNMDSLDMFTDMGDGSTETMTNAFDGLGDITEVGTGGMLDDISGLGDGSTDVFSEMSSTSLDSMDGMFGDLNATTATGVSGVSEEFSALSSSASVMNADVSSEFADLGSNASSQMDNLGADSSHSLSGVDAEFSNQMTSINDTVNTGFETMSTTVSEHMEQLATSIQTNMTKSGTVLTETTTSMIAALMPLQTSLGSIGRGAMQGFINGIRSKQPAIIATVSQVTEAVAQTLMRILRMNSPSRVMRDLGGYTMDGYTIGMEDKQKDVEDISKSTANTVTDELSKAANAQNKLQAITSKLAETKNKYADQTAAMMKAGLDSAKGMARNMNKLLSGNHYDQQLALAVTPPDASYQTSLMEKLIESVEAGKNIVMDTGELVGATYAGYDNAAGVAISYNSRWGR